MDDQIEPTDAALALSEIGRRREQVILRKVFPRWYWWAHAVLIVELMACIESGRGVLFVAGALFIDVPVSRAARAAPMHRSLVGPGPVRGTLIGLASFVTVLFGILVGTAFGLRAAGVPYPATIAATVTAVVFAVGAQTLVRYEAAVLVRRSRRQG
jgi:hypothetical protein